MADRKKKAGRTTFGRTRGWIAAGTLAAYAVIGGTRSALQRRRSPIPGGRVLRGGAAAEEVQYRPRASGGAVAAYEMATGVTVRVCCRRERWQDSTRREWSGFIAKTKRCACF